MCPGQEGEPMEKAKTILKFWPLHLIVLAITLIFEYINTITIPTPLGNILFLPMLFAMVAGLIIYLIKPIKWVREAYRTARPVRFPLFMESPWILFYFQLLPLDFLPCLPYILFRTFVLF